MVSPRRRSGRTTPRAADVQAGGGTTKRLPGRKKTKPGRYTPPVPRAKKVSPRWVPVIMLASLILGVIVVVINYLGVLPGGASNWYLLLGLGLIAIGFITATQYR